MKYDAKNPSFDKFIDTLLNKNVDKEPPPKRERFDDFIDSVLGKNDTKKK